MNPKPVFVVHDPHANPRFTLELALTLAKRRQLAEIVPPCNSA